MRAALDAHDDVLRERSKSHGGRLFKPHRRRGVRRLRLAPFCRRRRGGRPASAGVAGADGDRDRRGRDRAGPTTSGTVLNRAARVMAAGHGGQILLDGATAGLLSGVDLIRLGPRRLRDIAKPVDLFQVRAAGLRTEFPPLKTLDSTPGNLQTSDHQLRRPRDGTSPSWRLRIKAHRLVTLDRRRRRRQDTARVGGRRAPGNRLPRWRVGDRAGRRSAIPPQCPRRRPPYSGSPSSRA